MTRAPDEIHSSGDKSTAETETIVARSTPPGRSLKAVVRTSGPDTLDIVRKLSTDASPEWLRSNHNHRVAEQTELILNMNPSVTLPATVLLMKAPHSYTCEDAAEFQVPGSPPLIERLVEEILASGARIARPGEFTERAFLNGRLDLTQAEAVLSLIEARDDAERRLAIGQLEGKLYEKIEDLRDRLTHLCAYVESALDFSDQDIEVIDRDGIRSYLNPIRQRIEEILETDRNETPVREDPRGVLYGRPNVGKSSLFNHLIEEDRSIVTEIAGTTRDVIEGTVSLDQHSLRLFDTAGVNNTVGSNSDRSRLEQKMAEKTRSTVRDADVILYLEESRRVLNQETFPDLPETVPDAARCIPVLSKVDQLSDEERDHLRRHLSDTVSGSQHVFTSARTGEGLEALKSLLQEQISASSNSGGAFRLNMRHIQHLNDARDHLQRANQAVEQDRPYELIAVDLRDGLESLGKIVGDVGIEGILDVIFSEFCIGK